MAEELFPSGSQGLTRCTFGEMGARIGERVEFQLVPTRLHPRLYTHCIGYEPGESLLIRTPLQNNLPVSLHEGQEVVIRAFTGTLAYAFTTRVQRICIMPFLYLHLDIPKEVQCVEVRRSQRRPVRLLGEAKAFEEEGHWQPVMLLDLGLGGALVESGHSLGEAGDELELRFTLPVELLEQDVELSTASALLQVQPHRREDSPQTYRHRLKFQDLGKGELVLLQNFLLGIRA